MKEKSIKNLIRIIRNYTQPSAVGPCVGPTTRNRQQTTRKTFPSEDRARQEWFRTNGWWKVMDSAGELKRNMLMSFCRDKEGLLNISSLSDEPPKAKNFWVVMGDYRLRGVEKLQ